MVGPSDLLSCPSSCQECLIFLTQHPCTKNHSDRERLQLQFLYCNKGRGRTEVQDHLFEQYITTNYIDPIPCTVLLFATGCATQRAQPFRVPTTCFPLICNPTFTYVACEFKSAFLLQVAYRLIFIKFIKHAQFVTPTIPPKVTPPKVRFCSNCAMCNMQYKVMNQLLIILYKLYHYHYHHHHQQQQQQQDVSYYSQFLLRVKQQCLNKPLRKPVTIIHKC